MKSLLKFSFAVAVASAVTFAVALRQQPALAEGLAIENKNLIVDPIEYQDVASDLRCPTCTGLSVLDSEAAFSIQIKNEVKEQLVAGKHKDEILKFFTDRYGPWILRAPPTPRSAFVGVDCAHCNVASWTSGAVAVCLDAEKI